MISYFFLLLSPLFATANDLESQPKAHYLFYNESEQTVLEFKMRSDWLYQYLEGTLDCDYEATPDLCAAAYVVRRFTLFNGPSLMVFNYEGSYEEDGYTTLRFLGDRALDRSFGLEFNTEAFEEFSPVFQHYVTVNIVGFVQTFQLGWYDDNVSIW